MAWAVVLITLICFPAKAQDKQLFNHLALGISVGMDGVGLELAVPVTPYAQIRAGYAIFPYTFHKVFITDYTVGGYDIPTIPLDYTLWKGGNGKLLLDIFPGKKTGFHITAGVFAGPGNYIHWESDMSNNFPEEEYATRAYTINGFTFSTDAKGYVKADAYMKNWVPYAGLGYGRAVVPGKRLGLSIDLGVLITGGTKIQTYNYVNNPSGEPVVLRSENLISPGGRQLDKGWANRASDWPVLPMLKLSLFYNLF